MKPLLEMRTTPLEYKMVIHDAKLEMRSSQPGYTANRQKGNGLQIQSTPTQISISTLKARESLGYKNPIKATIENGKKGVEAANEAIGKIAREGNIMMDTRNKNAVCRIAKTNSMDSLQTIMSFLPSTGAEISFSKPNFQMRYEADRVQYDWRKNNKPQTQYTRGFVEIQILNYAKLEIEYTGGPIYIPRSADPNYTPPQGLNVMA
ncbi:MAG: DUF6470 family protein [Oscillospiraceae bacterium]